MKKLLTSLGVFFVLIIVLAFVVPHFIPLDKFKQTIETSYQEKTGQTLHLKGPLTFSLLPKPQVSLHEIVILSKQDGSELPLASIKEVTVKISLLSLIQGKLALSNIIMESPLLNFKKNSSGKENWEIIPSLPNPKNSEASSGSSPSSSLKFPIEIDHITLKNGHVTYKDQDQSISFENINLILKLAYAHEKDPLLKEVNFDLSTLLFNEKLTLIGNLQNLDQKTALFSAQLNFYDEKLLLSGNLSLEDLIFSLKASVKGSLSQSRLLSKIQPLLKSKEDAFALEATLQGTSGAISMPFFTVILGSLKGSGNGNFDIQKEIAELDLILTPGNIYLKVVNQRSEDKTLPTLQISSKDLKSLLDSLNIQTEKLSPTLFENFSLTTSFDTQEKGIVLKDLNLKIGPASLMGNIIFSTDEKRSHVSYAFSASNLDSLKDLSSFKAALEFLGETFKITGESSREGETYTTDTLLSTPSLTTKLQGEVSLGKNIDLTLMGSGKNFSRFLSLPDTKLGAYEITLTLQGDPSNTLSLKMLPSHLTIDQKKTPFKGEASLSFLQSLPKIKGKIILENLDLNPFFKSSKVQEYSTPSLTSSHKKKHHHSTEIPSHSSHKIWSRTPLNLAFLNLFEGEFDISLHNVTLDTFVFNPIVMHFYLEKGVLTLNPGTGKGLGGEFKIAASISAQKTHPITCKGSAKNIQLKNLDIKKGGILLTGGTLDLNVDLISHGNSIFDYVETLDGDLEIHTKNGKINGFDLKKAVSALNNATNVQGFLKLLDLSFSGGQTEFDHLDTILSLQKGIASLKTCSLTSDVGTLSATGFIDLPHYTLDIMGKAQLNVKNLPPFNVKITGPIDNPNQELDTRGLQNYLLTNAVGSIVNTLIEAPETAVNTIIKAPGEALGIVQNILGSKDNSSSSKKSSPHEKGLPEKTSSPSTSSDNPVGDLVQGGLKLLGL